MCQMSIVTILQNYITFWQLLDHPSPNWNNWHFSLFVLCNHVVSTYNLKLCWPTHSFYKRKLNDVSKSIYVIAIVITFQRDGSYNRQSFMRYIWRSTKPTDQYTLLTCGTPWRVGHHLDEFSHPWMMLFAQPVHRIENKTKELNRTWNLIPLLKMILHNTSSSSPLMSNALWHGSRLFGSTRHSLQLLARSPLSKLSDQAIFLSIRQLKSTAKNY